MAQSVVSSNGSVMTVDYDHDDLKKIESSLKDIEHNLPVDLAWSKNRTAAYAQRLLATYVAQRYRITKTKVRKAIYRQSANAAGRNAVLFIRDAQRPLSEFRVTHPKKAAPKGAQLKGGGVKPLVKGGIKAFWATMRSGHTGVFQRTGATKPASAEQQAKSHRKDFAVIKQLMGSSIPHMMDNNTGEGALNKSKDEIAAKLLEYTEKRVQYRIRKAAAGGEFKK